MTATDPDLTALIGSRICHDLVSPLGAIGNGVELLMMSQPAASPELTLISESIADANARIRFFRVAFGAAAADQRIARREIVTVLADIGRGGRLQVDWTVAGDLPRREVKLAFLLIQCLESAMPFGGQITVSRDAVIDGGQWHLTGRAARMKIDADLWERLSHPQSRAPIDAARVHFALVPGELAAQSRRLRLEIADAGIALRF